MQQSSDKVLACQVVIHIKFERGLYPKVKGWNLAFNTSTRQKASALMYGYNILVPTLDTNWKLMALFALWRVIPSVPLFLKEEGYDARM